MNGGPLLAVIILTRDETLHLPVLLESLRPLAAEVWVVDSGSTDGTPELAAAAGCQVVEHPFESYAAQLRWAAEALPISAPWVMRLDADERLTPELARELADLLPRLPSDVAGVLVKRQVWFWGRWIRRGGLYPTWLLRVWRRGCGRCEERLMDEHVVLDGGRAVRARHDIVDENRKGLGFWTEKHNRYADREVADILAPPADEPGLAGQAARRRWAKLSLYGRSPPFLRAFLYWLYRYVLRLGFLDGLPGLVFHFLQGFWYRFLVDAKLREARLRSGAGGIRPPARAPTAPARSAAPRSPA